MKKDNANAGEIIIVICCLILSLILGINSGIQKERGGRVPLETDINRSNEISLFTYYDVRNSELPEWDVELSESIKKMVMESLTEWGDSVVIKEGFVTAARMTTEEVVAYFYFVTEKGYYCIRIHRSEGTNLRKNEEDSIGLMLRKYNERYHPEYIFTTEYGIQVSLVCNVFKDKGIATTKDEVGYEKNRTNRFVVDRPYNGNYIEKPYASTNIDPDLQAVKRQIRQILGIEIIDDYVAITGGMEEDILTYYCRTRHGTYEFPVEVELNRGWSWAELRTIGYEVTAKTSSNGKTIIAWG